MVEEKVCDIPVQLSSSLEGQITSRIESNFDLHYLDYISLNFLNISSHYKKRIQVTSFIIFYLAEYLTNTFQLVRINFMKINEQLRKYGAPSI